MKGNFKIESSSCLYKSGRGTLSIKYLFSGNNLRLCHIHYRSACPLPAIQSCPTSGNGQAISKLKALVVYIKVEEVL
ncbi:MAG: hypothetical protein AAFQ37_03520, partial [Bacteroidota bacterium]